MPNKETFDSEIVSYDPSTFGISGLPGYCGNQTAPKIHGKGSEGGTLSLLFTPDRKAIALVRYKLVIFGK